jgi:hypothetical protein
MTAIWSNGGAPRSPSNSPASVYGSIAECAEKRALGNDVEITFGGCDECNAVVGMAKIARRIRRAGSGFVGLVGVQSNQFPRALAKVSCGARRPVPPTKAERPLSVRIVLKNPASADPDRFCATMIQLGPIFWIIDAPVRCVAKEYCRQICFQRKPFWQETFAWASAIGQDAPKVLVRAPIRADPQISYRVSPLSFLPNYRLSFRDKRLDQLTRRQIAH